MRRLSSSSTYFYKRIFPVLWFGSLMAFLVFALWGRLQPGLFDGPPPDATFLLMPLLMVGIGLLVFRKLVFDLVDEVELDGDWLVVKNRGERGRIALADVMNVNATTMTNPRRVTVMLRTPSRFGRSFSFMPASPRGFLSAFKPDPIAIELIERVDALRRVPR
jgi:hypothetical protein